MLVLWKDQQNWQNFSWTNKNQSEDSNYHTKIRNEREDISIELPEIKKIRKYYDVSTFLGEIKKSLKNTEYQN